jgi:hypothetical protein
MPPKSNGETNNTPTIPVQTIISYGKGIILHRFSLDLYYSLNYRSLLPCKDVIVGALVTIKPILSWLLAAAILMSIVSYAYNTLLVSVTSLVCPSIWGSYIPFCQDFRTPVPDFSRLVEKQANLYETMISQYNPDTISAIELKKVELATRDLQVMIKYSNLGSAHLLDDKLTDYIIRSRDLGRKIQVSCLERN